MNGINGMDVQNIKECIGLQINGHSQSIDWLDYSTDYEQIIPFHSEPNVRSHDVYSIPVKSRW